MLNKSIAKSRYWKQIKGTKFKLQPIIAPLHYGEKIKGEINSFLSLRLFFFTMFIPDHIVVYKTTNQHMRSNYSCVAELSQIFAGFAWAMYYLCLLNYCMIFRSLNEFVNFSTKICIRPSCFVHPSSIHL